MQYDERMIAPMRAELTRLGLEELRTAAQVDAALTKMATKVDTQNAGDPLYEKLDGASLALKAARALIFEGVVQPNGYTEPLLHKFRQEKKAGA